MPCDSHKRPAESNKVPIHEDRTAAAYRGREYHQKRMSRSNGSVVLWASFVIFLVATPKAGARPGSAQTSNTIHSSPDPGQDKKPAAPANSSDYVGAETCKA